MVISAHWEAEHVSVTSSTKLIFDFYGFPSHMYKATWDASEDVDLAKRVLGLIQTFAPDAEYDAKRGIDHGVWSPLKIAFPDGLPVVQVSLKKGLDLDYHIKLGATLRSLADENILVIGSGGSTHNLGAFGGSKQESWAPAFEQFVAESIALPTAQERNAALAASNKHPAFRKAHPREEHFVPLLVVSGAAAGKGTLAHFNWPHPNFGMSQVKLEAHEQL